MRTADGELSFPSIADLSSAYAQGLVEPTDEVLEEGQTAWRRVAALPVLQAVARRKRPQPWRASLQVGLVVGLGAVSLALLFRDDWRARFVGLVVALLAAVTATRVLRAAHRRPATPG